MRAAWRMAHEPGCGHPKRLHAHAHALVLRRARRPGLTLFAARGAACLSQTGGLPPYEKRSISIYFPLLLRPGFNDAEEIQALLRYVDEADIDDVAVFANVEEINTGHMSFDEQDVYLAMMRKISCAAGRKRCYDVC